MAMSIMACGCCMRRAVQSGIMLAAASTFVITSRHLIIGGLSESVLATNQCARLLAAMDTPVCSSALFDIANYPCQTDIGVYTNIEIVAVCLKGTYACGAKYQGGWPPEPWKSGWHDQSCQCTNSIDTTNCGSLRAGHARAALLLNGTSKLSLPHARVPAPSPPLSSKMQGLKGLKELAILPSTNQATPLGSQFAPLLSSLSSTQFSLLMGKLEVMMHQWWGTYNKALSSPGGTQERIMVV